MKISIIPKTSKKIWSEPKLTNKEANLLFLLKQKAENALYIPGSKSDCRIITIHQLTFQKYEKTNKQRRLWQTFVEIRFKKWKLTTPY